jgi:hypothetical protein
MPISYIDVFRPQQQDAVGQLLTGGTNVLTNALNNSIQIGRDSVNLRASQERDYLAERERVEALNQRKTEFFTQQQNVDRSFIESVFRDRRDTEEANADDVRDYKFKVRTDIRDAGLRAREVDSLIGARTASTKLAEEKFVHDRDEDTADRDLLKVRAEDILKKTQPQTFISRLFGADNSLPEDNISLGKELKEIGVTLRDPTLISRGDELASKGTKGVLDRREAIRRDPLRNRSGKKPVTDEERLVIVQREIAARENPNVQADKDLTQSVVIGLNELKLERDEILKRIAEKTGEKAPEEKETIFDRIRNRYKR